MQATFAACPNVASSDANRAIAVCNDIDSSEDRCPGLSSKIDSIPEVTCLSRDIQDGLTGETGHPRASKRMGKSAVIRHP